MKYDDPYKYMISGYYGIESLDEYENKVYLLSKVRTHIDNYLKKNKIKDFDYKSYNEYVKNNTDLLTKLQDSLILLKDINGPIEVNILIRQKVSELKRHRAS